MPVGAASYREALRWGAETYHALKSCCTSAGCRPRSATRAASRPTSPSNEDAVQHARRGDRAGRLHARRRHRDRARSGDVRVLPRRRYHAARARVAACVRGELAELWADWVDRYPIVSIEDGMAEDDWDGWARAHRRRSATACSSSATTSSSRTPSGSRWASTAAWPTRSSSRSTRSARSPRRSRPSRSRPGPRYTSVMSHRSGETEDTTIADLAVATELRPDQGRRAGPLRPRREVQPAAAHRGRPRRVGLVSRHRGPRAAISGMT